MEIRADSAYSNLYEFAQDTTNTLDLDMEFWRVGLHFNYGICDSFEIGMEFPLVHFNGGFLDSFIQEFHKFFGLPNGGRDLVPNNRFRYSFVANGTERFGFQSANIGIGDISFHLKHQVAGEDSDWPDLSWFAEIKFPTGKRSRGFGSGTLDFGIGALLDASYKRVHGHFNIGYFVLGGNNLIDSYMYNQMFSYTIAGEVTILPTWSVIVQLNGSTPLLQRTSLYTWNGVPLDLIVGFRGEEKNVFGNTDLIWQVGFSEDVTSRGPSVDFTAFLSIGFRFGLLGRNRPEGDWIALNSR